MGTEKKDRPSVAALERSVEVGTASGAASISYFQFTTDENGKQAGFVSQRLLHSKQNAIPGRELVKLLGPKDGRSLTQLVEQERRAGAPICAAVSGAVRGYYFAGGPEELESHLGRFNRRLHNVVQTRGHLKDMLNRMTDQDRITGW